MMISESLETWLQIFEKMLPKLSNSESAHNELVELRNSAHLYNTSGIGNKSEIEKAVRLFAERNTDVFIEVLTQIVSQIMELVDSEIVRMRATKSATGLSEQDRASGARYLALMQECRNILNAMKDDK